MDPVICKNDPGIVLNKIQEFLNQGRIIKDLLVLERTNQQIVLLLSEDKIDEKEAKIWWSGFSAGLRAALE